MMYEDGHFGQGQGKIIGLSGGAWKILVPWWRSDPSHGHASASLHLLLVNLGVLAPLRLLQPVHNVEGTSD